MTHDSDREGGSSETPLQVPASPPGSPPDFAPAGEGVRRLLGRTGAPSSQRRVAQVWAAAVGPENARNSRPVTLKGDRLICAQCGETVFRKRQNFLRLKSGNV